MKKGYIKLNRKIFEHSLWTKSRVLSEFEAWIDLIQSVRFQETDTYERIGERQVKYGRGQYPAARSFLAKKWGWGEQKVRSFLSDLKKQKMIKIESEQGVSIITLCNYDKYNSADEPNNQTNNQQINQPFDLIISELNSIKNQLATGQITRCQPDPNQNNKKEEEYINKETLSNERVKKDYPSPEISEKKISEVESILLSDTYWIETLCMNKHTEGFVGLTVQDVAAWISKYFRKLENEGETHKTIKDAKSHFANWWKIELEKTNKNETNKRSDPDAESAARKQYIVDKLARAAAECGG